MNKENKWNLIQNDGNEDEGGHVSSSHPQKTSPAQSQNPNQTGSSLKAVFFNLQKFSLHDGPGIRTTVFLKGCPLSCKWCSNPESQQVSVQILYDSSKCLHCGKCIDTCHLHGKDALSMKDGRIRVDFAACDGCLKCEKGCPARALSHEGDLYTVQEIVDYCLQDKDFYEESDGGVTISGGEGMTNPDFVETLVRALKKEGIHTAIETTGCVSSAVFKRLAPLFDLLLFDVKQANSAKHKEGTGLGNEQIITNLAWAASQQLPVLCRIPVIPGFNAGIEDAKAISSLIASLGLNDVQLLPFHQMGERKYEFLGRDYSLAHVKALHPEDLTEYLQVFTDAGLHAWI